MTMSTTIGAPGSGTSKTPTADAREFARAQDEALAETIRICYEGHPYYRRLMKANGLLPRHITKTAHLLRLPVTTKQDFMSDPEAFRLSPNNTSSPRSYTWGTVFTTGTSSGTPCPVYVSTEDHYAYIVGGKRRLEFCGIADSDVVANLFPLTRFPLGAYARAADEVAGIGASMVWGHTGRSPYESQPHRTLDNVVQMIQRHRVTVLWGVTGFVRRVVVRAAELGADFSSVRIALLTGEASTKELRADVSRRMHELGATEFRAINRYASTEQGAAMIECQEGAGFHNVNPDEIFHEVVHPETYETLSTGHGLLLFTHLRRRGTVLLRYAVGDRVSLLHDPCPLCGHVGTRISSDARRIDSFTKIKGTMVNLAAVQQALESSPLVDEFQIVIQKQDNRDPFSMDEMVLRTSFNRDANEETTREIERLVRDICQIQPRIVEATSNEIYDPIREPKPKRVVDARNDATDPEPGQL